MRKSIEIRCPHCAHELNPGWLRSLAASLATRKRVVQTGPPKVLRPCPHCHQPYGAQELRYHVPRCPKNPQKGNGRPRKLRPCPWCERDFGYVELQWHKKECRSRPGWAKRIQALPKHRRPKRKKAKKQDVKTKRKSKR